MALTDTTIRTAKPQSKARKQVAAGIDPSEHRKAQKATNVTRAANSFEVVSREWFAKHSSNWSTSHADRIIRRLERDIFPWIGGDPIADIAAPQWACLQSNGASARATEDDAGVGRLPRQAESWCRNHPDKSKRLIRNGEPFYWRSGSFFTPPRPVFTSSRRDFSNTVK